MTATDLIGLVRVLTFDDKVDQQTWKDDKYLKALNEARSYLFTNYPESRLNSSGTLQTFANIEEANLSNTMYEANEYTVFLVEYMCYVFFGAASGDTQNARRATEHYTTALRALDPRNRTTSAIGR